MKTKKILGVVVSWAMAVQLCGTLQVFAEEMSTVTVSGITHSKPAAVTNVESDELINIKFSAGIDSTSVDIGDITVTDETGKVTSITPIKVDSTTVGIYPGELAPQTTYTVNISGIKDENGGAIEECTFENAFKTADNLAPAAYEKGKILTNAASGKAVTVYSAADGSVLGTLTGLTDNDRSSSMEVIPGEGSYTVLDLGKETSIVSLVISTTATWHHSHDLKIYGTNDINPILNGEGVLYETLLEKLNYYDGAEKYKIDNWYRQYHFEIKNASYRYLILDGASKISESYFGEIYVYEYAEDLIHSTRGYLRDGVSVFTDFDAYENNKSLQIENVVDGSDDTYWFKNSTYPYFIIDLGGLKNIKKIACLPANGYNENVAGADNGGDYFRDNYIIKVSNSTDINEAVTVKQGASTVAVGEWIEAVLNGDNVYRYVIVAKPSGGFFGATEMKVYGSEAIITDNVETKVTSITHSTPTAVTNKVCVENNTVKINAGAELGGRGFVFYVYKNSRGYDIMGDEYKEKWEDMCKYVADTGISGIAADEWGGDLQLDAPSGKCGSTDDVSDMACDGETDVNKVKFFVEWFAVTDGLCKYYKKMFGSDLKEDLLYFRNSSADKEKGIRIVNQYLDVLRKRTADGEQFLYDMSKKYFGEDSIVLCHPTWWGDELDSALEIPCNGLDWWEVKKDFAQTDELILIPVRMARTRRCPENLWYNMWYSMRTLDIKTYYRETWINARYGGRTHYLGYECYEPGVVLCLNQKDYLEKCSEMEEKIEILNPLQISRPDSRILIIFGYEAVANWKISDPNETKWNRVSRNIHNAWKFTKELFESLYLCELIPSTEIGNGFVDIKDDKISYCGHTYDMLIYIMPEGADKTAQELIQRYAKVNENLIIVGNTVDFMKDRGLLNTSETDVEPVLSVLAKQGIKRNCGENYCVYEDGSVVFTTDGEKNVGNALKIDEEVYGMKIKFDGEDFLYVKPENGRYITAYGNCNFIGIM